MIRKQESDWYFAEFEARSITLSFGEKPLRNETRLSGTSKWHFQKKLWGIILSLSNMTGNIYVKAKSFKVAKFTISINIPQATCAIPIIISRNVHNVILMRNIVLWTIDIWQLNQKLCHCDKNWKVRYILSHQLHVEKELGIAKLLRIDIFWLRTKMFVEVIT